MSIVLAHSTARLYHRAPYRPVSEQSYPPRSKRLRTGPCDTALVQDARIKLARYGVPPELLECVHVLVSEAGERRLSDGVICHVLRGTMPAGSIIPLQGGICVTDIRQTALNAARDLSFRELVEYYYELCGAYELPFEETDGYRERPALTSTAELARYFEKTGRRHGVELARRAIRYVREGARSPMETAFVMMLVMPKREGGLGIRGLEMDYRIEVNARARHLTARSCFYCDVYLPRIHLDIEYHGFFHDDEMRAVEDDERERALRAMGHGVMAIRRWGFFNRAVFGRFMLCIRRKMGISPAALPDEFELRQEELRRFVLRRMA